MMLPNGFIHLATTVVLISFEMKLPILRESVNFHCIRPFESYRLEGGSVSFDSFSDSKSKSDKVSLVDFLNSFNVVPTARPNSGSLLGPNTINAKTNIKISPGTPILLNM